MGLTIRLRRAGKIAKRRYNFRIVVCESKFARDGRFIEQVGHYDPSRKPAQLDINKERINYWIKQGAQVSDTVMSLLKKGAK